MFIFFILLNDFILYAIVFLFPLEQHDSSGEPRVEGWERLTPAEGNKEMHCLLGI